MAVPKRRMSRSNTRHRRANWKAVPVDLVPIQIGSMTYRVPRRLVRAVQLGHIDPSSLR
ncbi:50S ribosomal protein L32 [Verrucosispora sp. WMMA2044]|uniref:Large ribosomal subunit protein bL32 n=1 Tax=Verrucosispora sioxanthis TaxID=2499994 RepID=A0A6M1LBV2_9ACTN|nr:MULTISPECIES: 50S ribosomal protein L32 [Micromonospora]NEE66561.1 50S ribosomal protein L32 [Verrucosispora sioxanthis]NGM15671.1 50S ribosomal protein L32 [Verrucosispora sioxanthis]WBB49689.1 50S ribosomal protein L32 [Verrucosispora sp. WMMA2044]